MLDLWSPFQRKNHPVTVNQIQYKDIKELETLELDEGFRIDYKIDFESKKKDLGKYVSSFANTDGGWIFFGVDESPVKVVNIPKEKRSDYNQIISTLLKSQCGDNIPQFETKFVKDPKNNSEGVLALYCYKGVNPPYLYKGKVYIRNGSSSEPQEINSRLLLDNLYKRKELFDKEFEEFCVRSVYVPALVKTIYETKYMPMLNIYIKLNSFNSIGKYFKDIKIVADTFVKENSGFKFYTLSMNSIVFQNALADFAAGNSTCTAELFFDGSLKIHMPLLVGNQNNKRDRIISKLPKRLYNYELYKIFEGQETASIIYTILHYYFKFLAKNRILLKNSKIKIDYTDIENSIMAFDNEKFYTKLKTEPLRVNFKQQQSSKYALDELLQGINKKDWANAIVTEFLFMAFGYMPFEKIDVLNLEETDEEN